MDQLARRGDFKNAIGILNYCIEVYPNSDQAYAFLAMAHFDIGEIEKGTKYLEKALELNPDNQFAKEMSRRIKR
jgi:tetratricopeptide (TPR) repeat protein